MVKDCLVYLDYEVDDMDAFLQLAADTIFETGLITNRDTFYDALVAREQEITTGVGRGVAFPHAYGQFVKYPFVILFRLKKEIDYKSIDGRPVDLFFVIGTPANSEELHLKILSRLAQNFAEGEFRQELRTESDPELIRLVLKRIFQPMVIVICDSDDVKLKILEEFSPNINFYFYQDGSKVEPFEIHIADLTMAIDIKPNNWLITEAITLEEALAKLRLLVNKNQEAS